MVEYGYYGEKDHYIAGVIQVDHHNELLLGYKRQLTETVAFSTDFQAGPGNSATGGFTYNLTPDFSIILIEKSGEMTEAPVRGIKAMAGADVLELNMEGNAAITSSTGPSQAAGPRQRCRQ